MARSKMASRKVAGAEEDWRLCVDWLVRCGVLPVNHDATKPYAELVHLAQSLRDGVLICHLLNILKSECIDLKDFSQRPQMSQFLCIKNIRIFLQTCKTVFNLRDDDLFASHDLFDMCNFGKVISTLSILSKTSIALKAISPGFPPQNQQVHDDHDYYNSLEDLVSDIQNQELTAETYYTQDDQEDEEAIYDTIVYGQRTSSLTPTTPKSKRGYCVKELEETESNYVDALNMILLTFARPLSSVIAPPEWDIIFRHIEDLAQIHTGFNAELQKACSDGTPKISDCFLKWKSKMLIYGEYCSHLPEAQDQIEESSKHEQINNAIIECQKKAKDGKFRLRDLLLVPMQRILKYHLLLKELLRNTDRENEDHSGLTKALESMEDLSAFVNEVKRDSERLQLINEIQASITELTWPENTSLKDYGRLQKDGELRVRSHADAKAKTRYIFLFDRVMLMCKAKGEVYTYKNCLILSNCKIDPATNSLQRGKGERWSSPFLFVDRKENNAYTFYAKNDEIRRMWLDALEIALDNNQPPGYRTQEHDFVMHTFEKPTECHVCHRLLRGIFFQGYLCKKKKLGVHKECITKASEPNRPDPPPRPIEPDMRNRPVKMKAIQAYRGQPAVPDKTMVYFEAGDEIEILIQTDPRFWKGRVNGTEGWFPKQLVRDARPTSYIHWTPKSSGERPETLDVSRNRPENADHRSPMDPKPPVPNPSARAVADLAAKFEKVGTGDYVAGGARGGSVKGQSPAPAPTPTRRVSDSVFHFDTPSTTGFRNEPWFVGTMSRETASEVLENHEDGTYLVRENMNHLHYAISIRYDNHRLPQKSPVKHIRIIKSNDRYNIADLHFFKSVPELIEFYQRNSLGESFPGLDTTLIYPFKSVVSQQEPVNNAAASNGTGVNNNVNPGNNVGGRPQIIGYAVASYDFAATAVNQLSLARNDRVAIISKLGGNRGWWKGLLNGKIGYFPCQYVREEGVEDQL